VFTQIKQASKICGMIPPHACPGDPLELLLPVKTAYDTHAYASLEHAIFPSYFHGKCQINGVNPSGCPNPDCSVVCGTPGSLVHFYPKLRSIVFEDTRGLLANATKPNSPSYKVVEKRVLDAAERGVHRMVKVRRGSARVAEMKKRQDNLKSSLRAIMGETSELLKEACGGEGLPLCSWARQMKAFILRYP
jgi:hypothetical protein